MSVPTSHSFAKKLHEAGLVADPKRLVRISIEATGGHFVKLTTEQILEDGDLDVIVRELKALQ